mgnify:CR=1 FL=1
MSNNKYKILIVEDEANIRSFIKTVLEANEYKVLTSDTCMQGQLVLDSHHPDLIILDLGLPDADGLEFIKYARKSSFTPIIVLSARSTEHDKVTALDTGANDYITKPFGTEELWQEFERLCATVVKGQHRDLFQGECSWQET